MFDERAEKLGLKGILNLPFITLSNGQTMRARIARTLMKAPEALLLDEPSSECFCLLFLAFFSLPLLSNCCPFDAIPHFPSFRFLVPPFLFLPRLFSPCLSFRLVSRPPCAFSLPSQSSSRFLLIAPFLTLFLSSLPSYLLPSSPTFGTFDPLTNTPFSGIYPVWTQPSARTSSRTPRISGAKNSHGDARAGGDTGVSYKCFGCWGLGRGRGGQGVRRGFSKNSKGEGGYER